MSLNVSFRRALVGDKLRLWTKLVSLIVQVDLVESEDQFVWKISKNSVFSVRSMYRELMQDNSVPENLISWKIKVPLKIKIFMWYLKKGVVLTKDNLAKRKWKGDKKNVVSAVLMNP